MKTIEDPLEDERLTKPLLLVRTCVVALYDDEREQNLFNNNLCERCLVFRFAYHMQNKLDELYPDKGYFVDCDYNSSCYYDESRGEWINKSGKPIRNQKTGEIKKRFIDIIVHKREKNSSSDFICFEIKKWNNCSADGLKKDENNLRVLTSEYGYQFGFHIIFGKIKERTKIRVFKGNKVDLINLF